MSNALANAELLEYLTRIAEFRKFAKTPEHFKYRSIEEFLIAHGTTFTPTALLPSIRPMPLGQCFENAYRLATRTSAFHYVEGYAMGIIPMHHAWVIDQDGNAYDPTWASGATGLGSAYIGVELNLAAVRAARRQGCLSALENWRDGYPALHTSPAIPVLHPDGWFLKDN
jgi:hypothetical protein